MSWLVMELTARGAGCAGAGAGALADRCVTVGAATGV